jgi:hypothetical protein
LPRREQATKHETGGLCEAALEKADNPTRPVLSYLTGYVAFFGGDYKTAITELESEPGRPVHLMLIAQSYERVATLRVPGILRQGDGQ